MKTFELLLSLMGAVLAAVGGNSWSIDTTEPRDYVDTRDYVDFQPMAVVRPPEHRSETSEVIATFKKIAPMYKETLDQEEKDLFALKSNVSSQLVNFHLDIIDSKASFVNLVIEKEEYILNQIVFQSQDDSFCLGFVRTSSEMNVNLAGVSFTNCINTADAALNTKVAEYSGSLGNLATKLSQLRLLDVFKGDNIFYSPANITQKLNDKLAKLQKNPGITAKDIENLVNHVSQDLGAILNDYNGCMKNAYSLAEQGLNMCVSQLTLICGATLWPASCKPNEWSTECPWESPVSRSPNYGESTRLPDW